MELQLSELQGPDQSLDWCRGLEDTSVQRSALLGQHRVLAWPCAIRGVCAGSRFRLFQGLFSPNWNINKNTQLSIKKREKKSTLFSFSLSFCMFFKISLFKTLKKMTGVLAMSEICVCPSQWKIFCSPETAQRKEAGWVEVKICAQVSNQHSSGELRRAEDWLWSYVQAATIRFGPWWLCFNQRDMLLFVKINIFPLLVHDSVFLMLASNVLTTFSDTWIYFRCVWRDL